MAVEVGQVLNGKVTGITNFGAFVELEDRQSGLVHISEISDRYIKDINDVLANGDEVKVKVVSIADDGKIGLSMRQVEGEGQKAPRPEAKRAPEKHQAAEKRRPKAQSRPSRPAPARPARGANDDFDSMMSNFLKDSEDRLASLRRNTEGKRGGRGGRRG